MDGITATNQPATNREQLAMNNLGLALLDQSNGSLDFYLENESTADIRKHIEQLVNDSVISTPMGKLKMDLLKVLESA